jgi:pimeloyl-ACP methyl ester carboxylesterase
MIAYKIYTNNYNNNNWITFAHGAGGSSAIWFKQIKFFQEHSNVLLLDLRGHGTSKGQSDMRSYTFKQIANNVKEVLDYLKIETSHFVGISLGTIVIRQLAEMYPQNVKSMIMGGAILKINFKSQILMKFGNIFKYVLPYLMLYKLFAFIIMPKENHKKSRLIFVNEAKKLYQKEFIKWFKLTAEINPVLKWFRQKELNIPKLYVMGEKDYMFLPIVKKVVTQLINSSKLFVIEQCGHVVNIEKAHQFNNCVLNFIKNKNYVK